MSEPTEAERRQAIAADRTWASGYAAGRAARAEPGASEGLAYDTAIACPNCGAGLNPYRPRPEDGPLPTADDVLGILAAESSEGMP